MPRPLTIIAIVVLGMLAAAIGEALKFGSFAYLGALVVALFLVSLTDRERFWGAPPASGR